jgi:hypothetical protein
MPRFLPEACQPQELEFPVPQIAEAARLPKQSTPQTTRRLLVATVTTLPLTPVLECNFLNVCPNGKDLNVTVVDRLRATAKFWKCQSEGRKKSHEKTYRI